MPAAHVDHATKAREVVGVDHRLRGAAGEADHGAVEQHLLLRMRRSIRPRVDAEEQAIAGLARADALAQASPGQPVDTAALICSPGCERAGCLRAQSITERSQPETTPVLLFQYSEACQGAE
jgi:hypothetical protein